MAFGRQNTRGSDPGIPAGAPVLSLRIDLLAMNHRMTYQVNDAYESLSPMNRCTPSCSSGDDSSSLDGDGSDDSEGRAVSNEPSNGIPNDAYESLPPMDGDGSDDSEGRAASNELSNDIPNDAYESLSPTNHRTTSCPSGGDSSSLDGDNSDGSEFFSVNVDINVSDSDQITRASFAGEEFPILKQFNFEAIVKENSTLEDDILSNYHASTQEKTENHRETLSEMETSNSVSNEPANDLLQNDRVNELVKLSQKANKLELCQSRLDIETRCGRMAIMYNHLEISDWMDKELVRQIKLVMRDESRFLLDQWMSPVARRVYEMVQQQREHQTFIPHDFNIHNIEPNRIADITRIRRYSQNEEDIQLETIAIVQDIMSVWFQFPNHEDRWRIWVIDALTKVYSEKVLVLETTWNIFRYGTKQQVLQSHRRKLKPSRTSIEPFEVALRVHASVGSPETVTVIKYMSHILDVAFNDSIHEAARTITDNRDRLFSEYWRQSIAAYYGNIGSEGPTELQKLQIAHPERYSPFREQTPSRERMKGADGPFSQDRIKTIPGIFSAILWRAVSFRTPFALNEQTVFEDINEFEDLIAQIPDREYYCNMAAYGTPDAKRGAINAKIYWDSLNKSSWLEYCKSEDHTFKDTLDFFIRGNPKPYPHLGQIGAFQLVVDLTYSSRLHPTPDTECIATCIHTINSGSMNGIVYLRGITPLKKSGRTKASIQECKTTLDKVIAQMTSSMSDFQQQNITVDSMLAENALCKFYEAIHQGLLPGASLSNI
ncbi:hypothetical protein BJ912DRAFT_1150789 [Pholiota molesta]|nr:hypothetical protein BJ912DRAFT_1150789 [Pholiota molesta]